MPVQVRPIRDDEFEAWVGAEYLAFHNMRSPAGGAAYRREVLGQPYERILGAFDAERLVGTYESFPAELTLPGGRQVPSDAISSVTVQPTHRRRGVLTQMISSDLRAARERGEVAAILIAAEYPIYGRFGFGPATQRVQYSLDPLLARFTRQAQASVELVSPQRMLEIAPDLFDRFRRQHPGQISRDANSWSTRVGLREVPWSGRPATLRCVVAAGANGEPAGYLLYRTEDERLQRRPNTVLDIAELIALSEDTYLALWRFCAEVDLIGEVRAGMRSTEEPLRWLLTNPRVALEELRRTDYLWLRPLDVPRLLASRAYVHEGRVVIDVADPLGLSGGRFELEGSPDGATCRETTASADLSLGLMSLGAISLGGVPLYLLEQAGLIEAASPQALTRAEHLFRWPEAPWCSTFF